MASIPQPVTRISSTNRAQVALYKVGAPSNKINDLSKAVTNASAMTDLSPELIVALMKTESEFNYKAISSKGYKGLMQTPWATFKWASVDTLHGAEILREKLRYSRGDLKLALALYKGGNNEAARGYAIETFALYRSLL
jgi:soluble lytic murein transglycosylase-like protein